MPRYWGLVSADGDGYGIRVLASAFAAEGPRGKIATGAPGTLAPMPEEPAVAA